MNYPIIEVITEDQLRLYGIINNPNHSKVLFLLVHGTGSNFFCESFYPELHATIPPTGIDLLVTNNRGSFAMDSWQDTGAVLEIFENSVLDIDSWIDWALKQGYQQIILAGHSHGTEKVVYYMRHGKYVSYVKSLILLGFADSVGNQQLFEAKSKLNLMSEAQSKVANGKGYELLRSHRRAQAGELPISAQTYLNYFSPNSALSQTLPFRNKELPMLRDLKIPLLAIIGDHDEYTIIPINEAMELIKKEAPHAEVYQIKGSGHCYEQHEQELSSLISQFIKKL